MMPMSRTVRAALVSSLLVVCLGVARPSESASIVTLTPGTIAGYIPLDLFGGTTTINLATGGVSELTLPGFMFAGETWTTVGIAEDGYLVVGGGASSSVPVPQSLPDPSGPNNVLAPFWADFNSVTALANVLTDGVGVWSVVEWRGIVAGGASESRFQVWLGAGVEDIAFSYDPGRLPMGVLATIGAEDKTGLYGAMYSGQLQDLRVQTQQVPDPAVPEPASLVLLGSGVVAAMARRRRAVRPGAER